MNIKKTIKKFGRCIIDLKEETEGVIGQSVLLVDNGYSWIGQLESAIERIKNYFPKAEMSVLTFPERKLDLQKKFQNLNYAFPSKGLRLKRYQIALEMIKMRDKRYDLIVLLSLDVTPLVAAMLFFGFKKIILYNQWGQWWSLRWKRALEIFKTTYVKKKTRFNVKGFLKRIGLFFILLQRKDEEVFRHSILVVDDGRAAFEHVGFLIPKIRTYLPFAKISILAVQERKNLFEKTFPDAGLIVSRYFPIKRYRISCQMFRLRKNRYDYIILVSLDVTPIIASMLFMKRKVLLFNRWYQWWSFKPKSTRRYFGSMPKSILNTILFVYLLISVLCIFLKRSFNGN